jgi:hypothetical protein
MCGVKNPLARLNKRGEVVLKNHPEFIDMLNVLKSIKEDDPDLAKKKRDIYSSIVEPCKWDISRAIEMGLIEDTDVEIAAYMAVGVLESAWLLMSMNDRYTIDGILDVVNAITFLHPKPQAK